MRLECPSVLCDGYYSTKHLFELALESTAQAFLRPLGSNFCGVRAQSGRRAAVAGLAPEVFLQSSTLLPRRAVACC